MLVDIVARDARTAAVLTGATVVCALTFTHAPTASSRFARAPGAKADTQAPSPQSALDPAQPAFRAGVEIVSLNVTVTDRSGRFVKDLPRESFTVFEDGVKQEVLFFSDAQLPTGLALLIDTSASMTDKMAIAQTAAVGFVERMRADDVMTIIDFDSRAEILEGFTSDQLRLTSAIRRTTAGGSTSLFNALYVALNEFARLRVSRPEQVRRHVIVVLSDGEDTSSLVPFDDVLELAKRSEVAIYAIGLQADADQRRRSGAFDEASFVLRQFAQETGGRAFFTASAGDLAAVYGTVADELAAQYTVGYASASARRDGRWRRVAVRIDRPDAIARTKQGYYGPTE